MVVILEECLHLVISAFEILISVQLFEGVVDQTLSYLEKISYIDLD